MLLSKITFVTSRHTYEGGGPDLLKVDDTHCLCTEELTLWVTPVLE